MPHSCRRKYPEHEMGGALLMTRLTTPVQKAFITSTWPLIREDIYVRAIIELDKVIKTESVLTRLPSCRSRHHNHHCRHSYRDRCHNRSRRCHYRCLDTGHSCPLCLSHHTRMGPPSLAPRERSLVRAPPSPLGRRVQRPLQRVVRQVNHRCRTFDAEVRQCPRVRRVRRVDVRAYRSAKISSSKFSSAMMGDFLTLSIGDVW
jgi:hypothetical protein